MKFKLGCPFSLAVSAVLIAVAPVSALASATSQTHIKRVDQMADIPQPLNVIDFRDLAVRFDKTVYDFPR